MSQDKIAEIESRLDKLSVTVKGEDGSNGLRSSVQRAHSAIKECNKEIDKIKSELAELKTTSLQGDINMQEKVVEKIDRVDRDLTIKLEQHQIYQNRMLIMILLAVIGSIIVPVFM